ncbi:MAG TPA: hypothetical protein VML91_13220 [Burkholderiales bacterium]|nr:hypothetical protein [Burkholderiales bacterium]
MTDTAISSFSHALPEAMRAGRVAARTAASSARIESRVLPAMRAALRILLVALAGNAGAVVDGVVDANTATSPWAGVGSLSHARGDHYSAVVIAEVSPTTTSRSSASPGSFRSGRRSTSLRAAHRGSASG